MVVGGTDVVVDCGGGQVVVVVFGSGVVVVVLLVVVVDDVPVQFGWACGSPRVHIVRVISQSNSPQYWGSWQRQCGSGVVVVFGSPEVVVEPGAPVVVVGRQFCEARFQTCSSLSHSQVQVPFSHGGNVVVVHRLQGSAS